MTVLSGHRIHKRLVEDDLSRRLVISPLLEPFEQLRDDQASVDVRLGFEFALMAPAAHGAVDELSADWGADGESVLQRLYSKHYVPFGSQITIHPHQLFLAATLEYVRLPQDLMAYVVGRSTWGRLGLIVATAVGIHPGFTGTLTLELRNLGETPLTLHPGQVIAQLFFHEVSTADQNGPGIGQYSGSVDILPRRISSNLTHGKLENLRHKG